MFITALVTPLADEDASLDLVGAQLLVSFQLAYGADLVLLAGTTGEGSALDEAERETLLDAALEVARPEQLMLSIGGGRLEQVLARGRMALRRGVRDLLLVDVPYARPSSTALRVAWYGPVAEALGEARLVPYTVPGRTGCELLPEDLARLAEDHPNVVAVKDASGRLGRMARVRQLCGDEFGLYCGDEKILRGSLLDPAVRADGVVSFAANLAPSLLAELVRCGREGDAARCRLLHEALEVVASLVAVTADEELVLGGKTRGVAQRVGNPVPVKAALGMLGVVGENCRPPLAALGPRARARVHATLRRTWLRWPEWLEPLASTFDVDVEARLDAPIEPAAVAFS